MTPDTPDPRRSEPGAKHDNRSHFGFGPGVTPVEDLTTSVFFVGLFIWLSIRMLGAMSDIPADTIVWYVTVMVFCQVVILSGTVFTTQRGIRRWRWRLANTDLAGGVYLRPWEKTSSATRKQ